MANPLLAVLPLVRDILWQTTFWLLAGAVLSLLHARRPARAHRLLLLALLAAVATPLLSQAVRHLGWGLFVRPVPAVQQADGSDAGAAVVRPREADGPRGPVPMPPKSDQRSPLLASPAAAEPFPPATAFSPATTPPEPRRAWSGAEVFFWTWGILLGVLGVRLLLSLVRGRRLLARARPVLEGRLPEALRAAAARLGLPVVPCLGVSGEVRSPLIWCWGRRPVVVLPATAEEDAGRVDWVSIFCHELAHWKRHDHWSSLAGEVLTLLLPWHLLTWWTRRRLHHLSERACDDWVLASGRSPVSYAEALLGLLPQRRPGLALTAVRGRHSLINRIKYILDRKRKDPLAGRGWTALAAAGVVTAAAVIALGQARPVTAGAPVSKSPASPHSLPPRAKTEPHITLSGRVLTVGDKPVAAASVVVLALTRKESSAPAVLGRTRADRQGRFRLLAPRRLLVQGDRLLLVAGGKGWGLGWRFLQEAGQALKAEAVIRLPEEQVRHGRLIDLQGQPAAGVRLHIVRLGKPIPFDHTLEGLHRHRFGNQESLALLDAITRLGAGETRFWDARQSLPFWPAPLTTDAQGRFTLGGVGQNQGAGLMVADDRYAFRELDVAPVQGRQARAPLVLTPPRLIEGTVTAADTGKPIRNARVLETSLNCRTCHADGGDLVRADWKGRRPFSQDVELIARHRQGFYGSDSRTDARGRFRLNAFQGDLASVRKSFQGDKVSLHVVPPADEPYLQMIKTILWSRGLVRQRLDFALPRGVLVRGTVTEAPSGKPVAGARVDFWARGWKPPAGVYYPEPAMTGPDGTFQMVLPASRAHLLVNGPAPDYLFQKVLVQRLREVGKQDAGGDQRYYRPDAWKALDLRAGSGPQRVDFTLRRVVLEGRLIGPDGKPITRAVMIRTDEVLSRRAARPVEVRGGRFAFPVHDLTARYRVLFLDAAQRLGAVVVYTGQQATGKPVTVRLRPCGSATARLVNAQGKPLASYRPVLWAPDAVWTGHADPRHNRDGPRTDARGRITFPALIPGATYRLVRGIGLPRDFVVESGQVLALGDITVKEPSPLEKRPRVNRRFRPDDPRAMPRPKQP